MDKLPVLLNIQDIGEFVLDTQNGFYIADVPYKYQGDKPPKISMTADENIETSVKNLKVIFENIESFIEEARKIIADDCNMKYEEAVKGIPLYRIYVSYKGDYQIEFIYPPLCRKDCTAVAYVFGDIETGHYEQKPTYFA